MNQSDYIRLDAVGLAEHIARREVSAEEVLEAALARAEALNPKLNAITWSLSDEARRAVRETPAERPLAGVPFLVKDLGAQVKGAPTRAGSRVLKDAVAASDSALVAAYRRAGLVIFGKTNTPEFGLEPVTEPEAYGPTLNPWDPDRTPGGSSGGAACAVAAGMVPAAHASDGGGSIRIPASCCGLFGLKPSRGRVTFAPADEGWGGLSTHHAVTRSVRDSAALLDIACVPAPGDPYWLEPPTTPFASEVGRDPGVLRIAFTTTALASDRLDPECVTAVRDAAALCNSLGHTVEEVSFPGDVAALSAATNIIVSASLAATLDLEATRRGRPIEEGEVERMTWDLYRRGKGVAAAEYVQAIQRAHAFGREVARFFQRFDILLLSTLGSPPIRRGVPAWGSTRSAGLRGPPFRLHAQHPALQHHGAAGDERSPRLEHGGPADWRAIRRPARGRSDAFPPGEAA